MLIILVIRHNVPRLLNLLLKLSHANNLKYTLNAKVFRIVLLGAEALFSSLLLVIITYIKFYCVSGELKGRRINRKALTKQTNNEPSIVWENASTAKSFSKWANSSTDRHFSALHQAAHFHWNCFSKSWQNYISKYIWMEYLVHFAIGKRPIEKAFLRNGNWHLAPLWSCSMIKNLTSSWLSFSPVMFWTS